MVLLGLLSQAHSVSQFINKNWKRASSSPDLGREVLKTKREQTGLLHGDEIQPGGEAFTVSIRAPAQVRGK